MGPEQQGPRSGAEMSWNTGMGGGALQPHPAPPGRETPQHGVNRGDFPGPQGEAGGRADSQCGSGPRRVQGLPTCLVLGPGMGRRGHLPQEGRWEMGRPGGLLGAQAPAHHPVIYQDPHSRGVLSSPTPVRHPTASP